MITIESPDALVKDAFERYGQKVKHYRSKNYYHTNNPTREDNNPSLSFGLTSDGKRVWFKDYASTADPDAILRKIGLDPASLKPESREFKPGPKRRSSPKKRRMDFAHPDAVYNYTFADGTPSYQVRRYNFTPGGSTPDKEFRQYHWGPNGRYQPGRGETPELLYRLPEVVKAQRILGCEGEGVVEALRSVGYVATTHAGGAKAIDKALPAYRDWLRDKDFISLPDNDQPGKDMAQTLADGLGKVVRSGATVDPALFGGPKADIADLIDRLKKELLSNEEIRIEVDRILSQAQPWQPISKAPGPKELERFAVRDSFRANLPPQLMPLTFEQPVEPAELDRCEITAEHHIWTSEGGKGKTFFYCNDPARCALCRERHTIKLRFYLEEIARLAYVDQNGNAAYSKPKKNEAGEFSSASVGNGIWYGKILRWGERHAWRTRYKRHRPGGFISPEVYPVQDGSDKFIALSLAPFEDMQPVTLTDDLLQRIVIGVPHTRASLLFAPARKQLDLALPRYSFEIPQYLNDRGIVATIPAPHSVLFIGPIKPEDVYSSFNTKAETFDDIGLILEEVALKSIDTDRLRGLNDHAPDYVIQSIHIVPEAKPAYLAVYNAGREGNLHTLKKFKRGDLPKLPTLQSGCADKGIYSKLYIPLTTHALDLDPEQSPETAFYYAKLEHLLEIGAI